MSSVRSLAICAHVSQLWSRKAHKGKAPSVCCALPPCDAMAAASSRPHIPGTGAVAGTGGVGGIPGTGAVAGTGGAVPGTGAFAGTGGVDWQRVLALRGAKDCLKGTKLESLGKELGFSAASSIRCA